MTIIFSDSFQSGSTSAWTGTFLNASGTFTVDAAADVDGDGYGGDAKTTATTNDIGEVYYGYTVPASNIVSAKVHTRIVSGAAIANAKTPLSLYDTTTSHYVAAIFTTATLGDLQLFITQLNGTTATVAFSANPGTGAFHALELLYDRSGAQPVCTVYLDGTQVAQLTDTTTGTTIAMPNRVYVGIENNNTAYAGETYVDEFSLADASQNSGVATTYSLAGPSTGPVLGTSTDFTVSLAAGFYVTAATTITPSDGGAGGTFTPSSVTLPANTSGASATFTYTAASSGAKTISTTNSGTLTNPASLTYTAGATVVILVTDPNWFWSPGTWMPNGTTYKQTGNQGYCKVGITGTTEVYLQVDTSPQNGQPATNYPSIRWHIGEGVDTEYTFVSGDTSILLASGLTPGTTYDFYIEVIDTTEQPDRWTSAANCLVRITGLLVDSTGVTASLTGSSNAIRPKRIYIFGDSITEGTHGDEMSTTYNTDAAWSYAHHLGWMLNAEFGQIGYSAEDLINGVSTSKLPGMIDVWPYYFESQSRLGEAPPDGVFVALGTNDQTLWNTPPATFASDMTTMLASMRAQWPNATLFGIVPFGGFMRSGWQQVTFPDANGYIIDIGETYGVGWQVGLDESVTSWKSDIQKVHPTSRAVMEIMAMLGAAINQAMSGAAHGPQIGSLYLLGVGR